MEGIWRCLAVRISELACRGLIKDFDLLDVGWVDLDDFLSYLHCGCHTISLNFTQNARMAEIVRLYQERAPKEIVTTFRLFEICIFLTYFALHYLCSLGIRRPTLVFPPFRSVSLLNFKNSSVRHITREFEFGALILAILFRRSWNKSQYMYGLEGWKLKAS